MTEIAMLDPRIIAMVQEIQAHPKLAAKMRLAQEEGDKAHSTIFTGKAEDDDIPIIQSFEQGIGFLAAEVGILLDGLYNYEAICDICDKIRERLVDRRTVVVGDYVVEAKVDKSPLILPSSYKH